MAKIIPITKSQLETLYKENTALEIANILQVSVTTINRRLKKYGISGSYRKTMRTRQKYADLKKGKWSGKNNPNWKGGIASLKNERNLFGMAYWSRSVKRRDNYICQNCGLDGKKICNHCGEKPRLHAHHLKDWATHPELRLDINNGITLCFKCHRMKTG
jgi:hypothetical protein